MQKITPFLWFDHGQLKEALEHYVSVFKDGRITALTPMFGSFEIMGQRFMALSGGPEFKFNEAVSFFISCDDQAEVDYYWERLTADGGAESQCGWLRDKYGLSWQVVPKQLMTLMSDADQSKSARVMQALRKMKKIVIAELEAAHAG